MPDVLSENYTLVEHYKAALEQIAGHFIPGQRNTYAPAVQTLDMIRAEVDAALEPVECSEGDGHELGTGGDCDECVEARFSR